MQNYEQNVIAALNELRQGRAVILTDNSSRENEGDLVYPAEMVTPDMINTMIRNGSGIVCLSLTDAHTKKLGLRLMVPPADNGTKYHTAFTNTIEAKLGVTTGVSAADRAATILAAVKDGVTPDDIVSPGHIFPLQAREGGVLTRAGHTEGSVDLVKLAGFKPAAVICELMNADGSMMQGEQLAAFANANNTAILSIDDIINYRMLHENLIEDEVSSKLPIEEYGNFNLSVIKEKYSNNEHMILAKEQINKNLPLLVRIHSSCATGDLFGSMRCDCKAQLHYSLGRIAQEGGILFYLSQEGRGIGLFNKIKAYALQEQGLDTIEANVALDLPIDARQYHIVSNVLKNRGIPSIRLLTNNPKKLESLKYYNFNDITLESIPTYSNACNKNYLLTKKNKLQHLIDSIL